MKTIKTILFLTLLNSSYVMAGSMATEPASSPESPWGFSIAMGYVNYENMVDPNTTVQRLAVTRDLLTFDVLNVGLEIGAQTGLASRLLTTANNLDALGGPAVQTVIKPFFDVLGTISAPVRVGSSVKNTIPVKNTHIASTVEYITQGFTRLDVFAKIGMAYRQMHFDRDTINPRVRISPELQVGLNTFVSEKVSIALAYQGIYASDATLTTNGSGLYATGAVKSIPTQNGGLVIVHYRV